MQLVFSNDLNTLVETVANVPSSRAARTTSSGLVDYSKSRHGRWLQIKLTDRLGSLANTKVTTLTEFIWSISDTTGQTISV